VHTTYQFIMLSNCNTFPPTYQNPNVSYDHRPNIIFDRLWQEGQHNNAQPTKPHIPKSVACHRHYVEIKEEMTKLLQEKIYLTVARLRQSYQKSYDHRIDNISYPQGTRILEFSKFYGECGKSTHKHLGRCLAQVGECVRLFSLSLTSTVFAWYAPPPNSINS
jgi:hypothetical protein